MDPNKLNELKKFIHQCKSNPSILTDPSHSFFRHCLESLGAKLPSSAYSHGTGDSKSKSYVVEESDEEAAAEGDKINVGEEEQEGEEIVESDIKLEGETVET
ncbi:hypothetical protein DITRI_Ditri04bG0113100 [Diplodiscus trichospermus]